MKSSIGSFALCFAAAVTLIAPGGFALDPDSVSLCPPSVKMTEHDGCQPNNPTRSNTVPKLVTDDVSEQLWKEIVALVNNMPFEVQSCVWRGPLRNGWTLDGAKAEISRCQREAQVSDLIRSAPSPGIRSCVWARLSHSGDLTLDGARAEISQCQRQIDIAIREFLAEWIAGVFAGIGLLVLTVRFRAKIAASLYNVFVSYLAVGLRFNRYRKRFLDKAIKEAENRLG